MILSFKRLAAVALAAALQCAPAGAQEKLVFAWTPNPQTPQVDVAMAKNYFKDAGLDVQMVAFASGREAFEALIGGQVDVGFMAEFPAAVGVLRGQKFGIIADLARYRASRIVASAKATPLTTAADLKGLKIGTIVGTNVDFFLSKVLSNAGVTADIVNASPGDLVAAVARGDVGAAATFPMFYGAAKKALGADYRELQSNLYSPHFVLAASPKALAERAKVLETFLGALVKADADVAADPATAQAAVLANLKAAMPKEALADIWKETEFSLVLNKELIDLLKEETAWILAKGVVKAEPPSDATIRGSIADVLLRDLKPSAVGLP